MTEAARRWLRLPWRWRLSTTGPPETRGPLPPADASYRILLDVPARNPALGFPDSAAALAMIVSQSEPRFAIGIFGGWGSGKTTLMQAIEARISGEIAVPVRFAAWRYEKEEHLIVPLLDTVREALVMWAEDNEEAAQQARRTAATVGRVMKSIVAGLSIKVGVPGAIDLSFDANKALARSDQVGRDEEARVARSFYHASFRALQTAFREFVGEPPRRRIVVFVDDLDRCLPENALQVLESMKLFFDVEGFVFIVGLDEEVIKYIVASKYKREDQPAAAEGAPLEVRVTGEDYVKKIFQLPYTLAPVAFEQLDEFLRVAYDEASLPQAQREDLNTVVRPHLRFIVRESSVNPREIKRYINSYILLTKINPELNRNAVLGLQTVAFREDWSDVRDALLEYGEAFVDALRRRVLERHPSALQDLDPDLVKIPQGFLDYLRPGAPGNAVLQVDEIDKYVFTGEAVRSARNRRFLDAIRRIADVRRALRETAHGALDVPALLENVTVATATLSLAPGVEQDLLVSDFDDLKAVLGRLEGGEEDTADTRTQLEQLTQAIRNRLLAIYRTGDLAGTAQPSPAATEAAAKSA